MTAPETWARQHGCRSILSCSATPLEAFLAGMDAECERIRQLALSQSAELRQSREVSAQINAGALEDFAARLAADQHTRLSEELEAAP